MDLAVRTAETALERKETPFLESDGTTITAQSLRNQQLALQGELREMMTSGDAAGVIRIRKLLNDLPDAITAARVAELRQSIDAAGVRLNEIKDETEYAERIKGEKNKVLAEKIKAVEEAGLAVERVNFILYQLDTEAEGLREARREYKQRLNKIIEDADAEIADRA